MKNLVEFYEVEGAKYITNTMKMLIKKSRISNLSKDAKVDYFYQYLKYQAQTELSSDEIKELN